MDSKKIGALAGIVGLIGLVVQHVPGIVLGRWVDGGFEGAIPMIGTVGQTVTAYTYLTAIVGPLATLALAVGLGYYIARWVDFASEYRRVGRAIAVGSVIGVTLGGAPALVEMSSVDAVTILLVVASLVTMIVEVALLVTVGAIAGAAVTHFRTSDGGPSQPSEADTEFPADAPSGSASEHSQAEAQPHR